MGLESTTSLIYEQRDEGSGVVLNERMVMLEIGPAQIIRRRQQGHARCSDVSLRRVDMARLLCDDVINDAEVAVCKL